ncbi:MAG: hypothetical protein JXA97_00580 [Anaerolineales bacterium]|nr:hypothetical protein [Anaerolineales bacterium]
MNNAAQQYIHLPTAIERAIGLTSMDTQKPVAVIGEYPAHMPAVEVVMQDLVQALIFLIQNTIEETDADEVRIRASLPIIGEIPDALRSRADSLHALQEGGPWALVTVSDVDQNARLLDIEIPKEELPADAYRAETISGARSLIERQHGHLWMARKTGVGMRYVLALPLHAARSEEADLSPLHKMVATHLTEEANRKRLLLHVEADDMRQLLETDLIAAGYEVTIAGRGEEVLSLSRRIRPDLILLDLLARSPQAFDIARVLKQDRGTSSIPVLFLTATFIPAEGVQMGAVDFVLRPLGTGALLSTVDAVLQSGLDPASRLLVVEPDDVVRENMLMMIQAHGYLAAEARGTEEALALVERLMPQLVLINAELARGRDYLLIRGLRQLSGEMKIYVLANALSDEEGQAAITRGASGYGETDRLPELLSRERRGSGTLPPGDRFH